MIKNLNFQYFIIYFLIFRTKYFFKRRLRMGRPATKPAKLKDGFYIEVKNQGGSGVLVRRDSHEQMLLAAEDYSRTKVVNVKGEMRNDKWVNK
jgi:hypothetical protein